MKMKKIVVLFLVMTSLIFSGCSKPNIETSEHDKAQKTVKVVDSRGKEVEINYPAERIVCLLNSGLNDIYMLGAKDKVVGIDKWTYDTEVVYNITSQVDDRLIDKSLPAVDNNIEKIVSLNPDVVIIWTGNEEDIKVLEEKGIKVVAIQVNNFDEVFWKMELIGKIVGKEDRSEEIINYSKNELEKLTSKLSKNNETGKLKTSAFVWGPSKLDFAGDNSTGDSILKMANVKNVASEINKEHFIAKIEEVIKWNPDSIVMWNINDLDPNDYFIDKQWHNIEAVKNKEVYELPNPFYCDLWTVKYIHSVKFIDKKLYPEIFNDLDLEIEKDEMLKFLYNTDFR